MTRSQNSTVICDLNNFCFQVHAKHEHMIVVRYGLNGQIKRKWTDSVLRKNIVLTGNWNNHRK